MIYIYAISNQKKIKLSQYSNSNKNIAIYSFIFYHNKSDRKHFGLKKLKIQQINQLHNKDINNLVISGDINADTRKG